jgi:hypothetical protein
MKRTDNALRCDRDLGLRSLLGRPVFEQNYAGIKNA